MASFVAIAVITLQLVARPVICADSAANDCDGLLSNFTDTRLQNLNQRQTGDAAKMLFFVHIPRTAGRNFYTCFLKLAYPPSKRCAKSYDVLRLNASVGHCGLLSSHDDWSVEQYLPAKAKMVTQIRDPVSRVLSAYEFSVEVAARVLIRSKGYKHDPAKVNTRNVWPWSILVPLIEKDMLTRVAADHALNKTAAKDNDHGDLNPYDHPLYMPLHEFAAHPVVDDLLGNAAAMQLLGLTQYSHWEEAAAVRSCARSSAAVRSRLLEAAQARLRAMAHVGVTEEMHLSIASLAATLEVPLNSSMYHAAVGQAFSYEDENDDSLDTSITAARAQLEEAFNDVKNKRMELERLNKKWQYEKRLVLAELHKVSGGVDIPRPKQPSWLTEPRAELAEIKERLKKLLGASRILRSHQAEGPAKQIMPDSAFLVNQPLQLAYQLCTRDAIGKSASRRVSSLGGLVTWNKRHTEFSQEARDLIPADVVQLIRDRNGMDAVLHEHATELLHAKAKAQEDAGLLFPAPFPSPPDLELKLQQVQKQLLHQSIGRGHGQTKEDSDEDRGRDEL